MLKRIIAIVIPNPGGSITNPILPPPNAGASGNAGVTFLQKAIPAAISLGLIIGVLVFFFILITGAIKWISSGGDKQKVEDAKGTLTNALIGLVILFLVFAIIQLLNTFFNVHLFELVIPTLTGS